jgi:hypothetical protein
MKRVNTTLRVAILAAAVCGSAQAGWPELRREMHVDKLRNNAWPQPFRGMDAQSVVSPLEIQKNNGWRAFNTVGSIFFTEENQLTDAGQLKVATTLTRAPSGRQVLFVLKGDTPEATQQRLEAVQIAVSGMVPVGPLPQILITDRDAEATSGEMQTAINRGMARTMPVPRLPRFSGLNTPTGQSQMNPGDGSQ